MSFAATLELDGSSHRVLECDYTLQRSVDFSGRPSSDVNGGTIDVVIESSEDTGFFEWMCEPYTRKTGSITFFKTEEEAALKTLEFEDAYLIHFQEMINTTGEEPMRERLRFSAKVISCGGGKHENEWPS